MMPKIFTIISVAVQVVIVLIIIQNQRRAD